MILRTFRIFALVVAGTALGYVGWRVLRLERGELDYESPLRSVARLRTEPTATPVSVRLGTAELHRGEHATFEVCATDPLSDTYLDRIHFVVWRPAAREVLLRVPYDAAHAKLVKRTGTQACLLLGGGAVPKTGDYAVELVWPKTPLSEQEQRVAYRARILARVPLAPPDRLAVAILGFAILLWVVVHRTRARPGASQADERASEAPRESIELVTNDHVGIVMALLASLLLFSAVFGVGLLPFGGSTFGFLKGLCLAAFEVIAAFAFARVVAGVHVRAVLGLEWPSRPAWQPLTMALGASMVLVFAAKASLAVVPSTSEAPIQTFVSWPSGSLSFAALAVVVPVAEEIFFRGFLFGSLERRGRIVAFGVTVAVFVLAHVQQTWGGWGGLVAIGVVGLVLTGLRAATRSVLVPMTAHLLYNMALSLPSLVG